MELSEAIHTQRAIRRFSTEPVPDGLIHQVLDAAIRAPSGGNSQPWTFVVITDPQVKLELGSLYKRAWDETGLSKLARDSDPSRARVYGSAEYLADGMGVAPVLLLACVRATGSRSSLTSGASIYPAVQNLMLAARDLGLGTVITTIHKRLEAEVKELIGIPDDVETAALVPMGYPEQGTRFGLTKRKPVEEVAFRDRWGQHI